MTVQIGDSALNRKIECTVTDLRSNGFTSTDLGFNLGGYYNMEASSYKPFVEARLHFVDQAEWLSFGFGIRF